MGTSALRPLSVQGRQSNPFYTPGPGAELFCQGNFKGCLHYNSFLYLLVKSRSKDCLYGKGAHYLGTAFYPAEHAQRSRVEIREKVEKSEILSGRGHEIMLLFCQSNTPISSTVSIYSRARARARVCVCGLVQMWAYLSADLPFCKVGSATDCASYHKLGL